MPFKKGKSGNPEGKKRKPTDIEFQALCKLNKLTPMAVDVLEETMTSGTKESLAAAIHVLDRVWGKPKQAIDSNVTGEITVNTVDRAKSETPEQWLARVQQESANKE